MTVPASLMLIRGQAGYMRRVGYDLLAVSSPGSALGKYACDEGVEVFGVPLERRITPLRDVRAVWQMTRLMRSLRPDIVHAHTPKAGLVGMLAALCAGVPRRIYHMRGLPLETAAGSQRFLLRLTERVSCLIAHRVLCVSQSLRTAALRAGLAGPRKLRVLAGGSGNGVDALVRFEPGSHAGERSIVRAELGIPEDAVIVLFMGRLVRDKGIEELVTAWREVRAQCSSAWLLIVGPLEFRDAVGPATLSTLRQDDRVRLTGERSDTPRIYAASDIVVLPSHREGFPNVPLEAAAMGLPVVVSDATGCIDAVVGGLTGTICPVGDADALAIAISSYVANSDLRGRHGAAGRRWVIERFSQEVIWRELATQYRMLSRWRPIRGKTRAKHPATTSLPITGYAHS